MESSTPQSISPAIAQSIYSAPIATESVVVSPIRYEPSDEDRKEDIDYTRDREEKDLQLESIDEKGVSAVIAQEFPDGGLYGWLAVGGAWCASFVVWGFVNSFGVFQAHYQVYQLKDRSPSDISWIGSIQLFMILACAIISGKAFDTGYLYYLMAASTLIYAGGLFGLSFASTYPQIFVAQGVASGVASGILFLPAVSTISHYFQKKRATALGILATGSSVGGVVYPILINRLLNNTKLGFAWTVRVVGFLTVGLVMVAFATIRTRLPPRKGGRIFDLRVFKDPILFVFVLGESLVMWGLYTPMFYLQTYAILHGVNENIAFYALSILSGSSLFGRIIPNWLADTWGPLTVLVPNCLLSGILIFLWLPMGKSQASLIVFAILYGFASGAYVSTMPACVASLTTDMREMGIRMAMCFCFVSLFALTGTPISGALIKNEGGYIGAACFSGAVVLLGTGLVAVSWWMAGKKKGTIWV